MVRRYHQKESDFKNNYKNGILFVIERKVENVAAGFTGCCPNTFS
jgi:hypothetical protein